MKFKVIPLSIQISNVVIGEPEGFNVPQPFVEAKDVFVGVALWPLLRKEVNVDAIRLSSPHVELVRNAAGAWNYETGSSTPAVPDNAPADQSSSKFTLAELKIEDGQVALQDLKAGTPRDVYEHIDLTLKNLGAPSGGSIDGKVRLDTMAAALSINSTFTMADAIATKGTLSLKSDRNQDALDVTYDVRRDADGGAVTINALDAKIGSLSATAAGSIDMHQTPYGLKLNIKTANAPIGDLLRIAGLYGAKLPEGLKAEGLLTADVQVSGTSEKPLLAGKIQATKAQITAKEIAEPVRASELEVDFTPDVLTTHPFTIETGSTKVAAQATVAGYSGPSPKIDATLQTNGAKVEELLRMASAYGVKPPGLSGSGLLSIDMKVSQANKDLSYSGSGSLKQISISSPDLPKPLSIPAADVKFTDDRVVLDHLQAGMGSMHLDGSASVKDFSKPKIQFDAKVDQINVAEIQGWSAASGNASAAPATPAPAPSGKAKPAAKSSSAMNDITANGTINVGKILYNQVTLNNVKATVAFANGIFKMDPLTASVFGGQEMGSITANLRDATTSVAIQSKLAAVDSNQLLSSTTSIKNILSGPFTGNVDLKFQSKPGEDIAKTLNGNVKVQLGPGKLAGVQILNEMASIGKFLGYTKKTDLVTNIVNLTGSMKIENGMASTDDLFLNLGDGTLSGKGTVGLADQSLKLKIMTVLSKEFIQKNAPGQIGGLLSTVLANQKGEMIVPAVVSGTFSSPKFGPDGEQFANMKLKGLLPTANNPAALTSGIKGIVDAFSGKSANSSAAGDGAQPQQQQPQDGIFGIIDQFRKKKPEAKQ